MTSPPEDYEWGISLRGIFPSGYRLTLSPEEREQHEVQLPTNATQTIRTLDQLTEIGLEKFCTSNIQFALENDLLARAAQVRYERIITEANKEARGVVRNSWFFPWKVRTIQESAYREFERLRAKIIEAYHNKTCPYREIMEM